MPSSHTWPMSRKRTNSVERMSATPSDEDVELEQRAAAISSQSSCGMIPFQAMKPATTTELTTNVIAAVSVADGRDDDPRECEPAEQRRARDDRHHRRAIVASTKNAKSTIPISSQSG